MPRNTINPVVLAILVSCQKRVYAFLEANCVPPEERIVLFDCRLEYSFDVVGSNTNIFLYDFLFEVLPFIFIVAKREPDFEVPKLFVQLDLLNQSIHDLLSDFGLVATFCSERLAVEVLVVS